MPPIPKPTPKPKKAPVGLRRGGRKPKDAGRRYEHSFANKHGYKRIVGSGAFGALDPMLLGDVSGEIGRVKFLAELKSYNRVDGRGSKVISFPVSILEKIKNEAILVNRVPLLIYHVKGATNEWAILDFDDLKSLIEGYEQEIERLSDGG